MSNDMNNIFSYETKSLENNEKTPTGKIIKPNNLEGIETQSNF